MKKKSFKKIDISKTNIVPDKVLPPKLNDSNVLIFSGMEGLEECCYEFKAKNEADFKKDFIEKEHLGSGKSDVKSFIFVPLIMRIAIKFIHVSLTVWVANFLLFFMNPSKNSDFSRFIEKI